MAPQLVGLKREFGPGCMNFGQVFDVERVFFDGDEMQTGAAGRVCLPGGPGREEVQAKSEADFEDREA